MDLEHNLFNDTKHREKGVWHKPWSKDKNWNKSLQFFYPLRRKNSLELNRSDYYLITKMFICSIV